MHYQITLFELEGNPFAIPYSTLALSEMSKLGVQTPIFKGEPRRIVLPFMEIVERLHSTLEIGILHPNGTLYPYQRITVN